MLRLRIAESLPWVDSRGRIRSPFEELTLLDGEARTTLESGTEQGFRVWKFGVLTDGWDAPESSKPQLVGVEDGEGTPVRCFAVGAENAPEFYECLAPLWVKFLSWLIGHDHERVLLSDEFRHPRGEWLEIGPALAAGLLGDYPFEISPVGRAGLYTARFQMAQLKVLLHRWWPSGLGMLAGVSLFGESRESVDNRIAQTGKITSEDLTSVSHYFQTSRSFDNLGLVLMTRGRSWDSIRAGLEAKGWIDAKPVELVLDLRE